VGVQPDGNQCEDNKEFSEDGPGGVNE
jgi:hypothetical protein